MHQLVIVRFQTLIHGDAKPANFLWNSQFQAAAVDFQYVGSGCGVRDVAYFLDGCLGSQECWHWLDIYFEHLSRALYHFSLRQQVLAEWRALFPIAWCDLLRFEQGWGAPGQLTAFSRQLLEQVRQQAN